MIEEGKKNEKREKSFALGFLIYNIHVLAHILSKETAKKKRKIIVFCLCESVFFSATLIHNTVW